MSLGNLFLNLSLILYLFLYLPQIIHNARLKKFNHMSLSMHLMILQAYACDLCYGLSHQLPWQYLTVSCIGLFFICIQHGQWYWFKRQQLESKTLIFLCLGTIALSWPWLIRYQLNFDWQLQINGWVSRVFFMAHFLPQILKNQQKSRSRAAINPLYLMFSIILSLLDLLAAYLLQWGWVNMLGGACSLSLKLILAKQIRPPVLSLKSFMKHPICTITRTDHRS
jgi:uncharacterized protein with PQ loop repeat